MNLDFKNATTKIFSEELIRSLKDIGNVLIFGAGLSGQYVFKRLDENGVDVNCFIDSSPNKQGRELFGRNIISLDDAVRLYPGASIVIASMWYEEIKNKIWEISPDFARKTYNGLSTMNWETVNTSSSSNEIEYIRQNLPQFEKLYDLFEDNKSKETLEGILNYRLTRNPIYIEKIKDSGKEYTDDLIIPQDVKYSMEGKSVIDAGAFDGDTLITISDYFESCKKFYCYETNINNCNSIEKIKNKINAADVYVIQKALWSKSGLSLSFDGAGLSGHIGKGETVVKSISIDDSNIEKVGFIKMDIEGAEREAIKGGVQYDIA